jgi:hypothetical protein
MSPSKKRSLAHICFNGLRQSFLQSFCWSTPRQLRPSAPDPVLGWIGIMNDTVITGGTSPLVTTRVAAMVSASVFDAVNGIERRYQPQFVRPNAQHRASQRAAAIQAAYAILLHVYPTQSANLTAHLNGFAGCSEPDRPGDPQRSSLGPGGR